MKSVQALREGEAWESRGQDVIGKKRLIRLSRQTLSIESITILQQQAIYL